MKKPTKSPPSEVWDVVVIGGGPAGMMAAGRSAEAGARTVLLEKNPTLGKKLLITGGGRCNVTNAETDVRKLLSKFNARERGSDQFLFSAFSQWSVPETLTFFHTRNMPTKEEEGQRVFPISNKAQSVWDVLVAYVKEHGVSVRTRSMVRGFEKEGNTITAVILKDGTKIHAKNIILATGGKSHPKTGSTGEGFEWLKELGHTVVLEGGALVPIALRETWVKQLAGVSLPDCKITVLQSGVKQDVRRGKLLFTHVGISGPTVLNMSNDVGELLKYGSVELSLDVLPEYDFSKLNDALQELFKTESNKKFKNAMGKLIPARLVSVVASLSHIDEDTFCHSITREKRVALMHALKEIPLTVKNLLGYEKAVITSGGVALSEVDFKTMQSRLFPNLYLIGDVLNVNRPSGGYSLQLCWTTGFVAGNASAQNR